MDKENLIKLTVPKLREEALKIEGLTGVHGMKKGELLTVLAKHHGIVLEEHRTKRDYSALKKKIIEFRKAVDDARTAGDLKKVKKLRRRVHALKHETRK
jgi:hypothetical protein